MKRILIIEDDKDLVNIICEACQDLGYVVDSAEDGQAALAQIEKQIPGLILCRYPMPFMNTPELAQHLRGIAEYTAIPFIIMPVSGLRIRDQDRYTDVLPKPFSLDALELMLQKHLPLPDVYPY